MLFDYRRKSWQETLDFIKESKGLTLDLACGNGSNTCLLKKVIGLDVSFDLLKIAKKKCDKLFMQGDMRNLPFKDNSFNNILFIAGFHHLRNIKDRNICLKEIKRVLRKNSRVLLSVWTKGKGEKILKWGKKEKRYYYFFEFEELYNLIKKYFKIIRFSKSGNNYFFWFRK